MKKLLFLALILSVTTLTAIHAQNAPDPATMLQQMKERIKPQMMERTGLTETQVDKVIEINFEMRMAAAGLKDLNEADRSKRIAELKAAKEKKLNDLLTPEQIKAVNEFYENMGKSVPQKN